MRLILLFFFLFSFAGNLYSQNLLVKPDSPGELNYSGDNTEVVSGENTFIAIRVSVLHSEVPQPGKQVLLRVISTPRQNETGNIIPGITSTGPTGIAEYRYFPARTPGKYLLMASLPGEPENNSTLIYTVNVRSSFWYLPVIFGILGGLGLFLFGINYLSEGLKITAGNKMRNILSNLTNNKFKGLAGGVFITTVIQSSSAVSVMLIRFVDSEIMKFRQTVPVVMGAALGTSITLQIISINISQYALVLVAAGFILSFLVNRPKIRNIGQSLTGSGLLFLGLLIMSEAVVPLRTYQPITFFLTELDNPLTGVIVGIIFTAITQSSSAFIGLLIILGQQGLISLEASISLFIGSNIGTSVTAVISAVGNSSEARKVAFFHTFYRISGALIFIFWIPSFADLIRNISFSEASYGAGMAIPREIANAHLIFYIILTIISLPFTGYFADLTDKLIKSGKHKESSFLSAKYLDDGFLNTPSLALNLVKQETIRMANVVQDMINDVLLPFLVKEPNVMIEIEKNERLVNFLFDKNTEYLLQINRLNRNSANTKETFQMLSVVKEIEQIADIISTNLLPKARYWISSEHSFSDDGKKEIVKYHSLCQKQLRKAIEVFRDANLEKAKNLKKKGKEYISLAIELEKNHFERLINKVEETVGSSKTHIELLGMLNAITRHSTNIARIILT